MFPEFIHLRVHSEYSLVDGLIRVKPLVKSVFELGMPAVAVTDVSNLFALVKFYRAAIAQGIKPIVGAEVWVEHQNDSGNCSKLVLFASNNEGYQNLTRIISLSFLEGRNQEKAICKREWLHQHAAGLIVLSGGVESEIGEALIKGNRPLAKSVLREWMDVFPERFYIELQRNGRPNQELYIARALELASEFECPPVATNEVCFQSSEDFEPHEARVCINEGRTLDDPRRPRRHSDQQYLRSAEEMRLLFADVPVALQNSVEIAKRCNLELTLGENYLPDYPIPEGMTEKEFFRKVCLEGLDARLQHTAPTNEQGELVDSAQYYTRLDYELGIIIQMGFPGYFLIVMDFIRWARENDIPVGPGRGSGAGSIVAWALNITDLDPIKYELLFERFLNPERVSMPDFDIDFCMDGRDRVIQYVADTYGREAVSQIITFGTMAAKAVVRDVARVQGKAYGLADKLSKLIPFEVGMTLTKALKESPEFKEFTETNEEAKEIMEMSLILEGVVRNVGKHAGGVVIAPGRITDFSPVYVDESGENLVTQFDKDDVEAVGLVKFDFLGLRTLTIIDWALETINKELAEKGEEPVDIDRIPLDDAAVYKLLGQGNTTAVFQLESRGMKDLIKRLLPNCFEDIVALVALFRPGPLGSGMVDDFIDRKHGADVTYLHPSLEPILENTYGVILYQEQVMQIAQVLAGYTLGAADMLRRAMGKKKPEEMAKQREIFAKGAAENNVDADIATEIFDLMEKFAGYGFNKSHSAAYALVSYQTAWLKYHYPSAFMAAVMSADMHNTEKVVVFIEDARNNQLELHSPDINSGQFRFTVDDEGKILYGLGAIKGLGEGAIEAIVDGRKDGEMYSSLFDFCVRMDTRKVNKRGLEALVRAGAMDCFGIDRGVLMANVSEGLKLSDQNARTIASGTMDLFAAPVDEGPKKDLIDYKPARSWNSKELLSAEKETLGLYLSGHPIDQYEGEIKQIATAPLAELAVKNSTQTLAGLVVGIRTMKSKRGQTIAFVTLDDRSARVEVALFGEAYQLYREKLVRDSILVIQGDVSFDEYSDGMRAQGETVMSLDEARQHFSRHLQLDLNGDDVDHAKLEQLGSLFSRFPRGRCPVRIHYRGATAKTQISLEQAILPSDEVLSQLTEMVGADKVQLIY
ncbi:MAG: DNA polymerase III subunit alpha [Pseudomonadales bacterium]|nr:DNA polymerase III subunit alpha [Pseudomonadales bacterium]